MSSKGEPTGNFMLVTERRFDTKSIEVEDLRSYAREYLVYAQIAQQSRITLKKKEKQIGALLTFLENRGQRTCGRAEILLFFGHLSHGHLLSGGRWGRKSHPVDSRAMHPNTIHGYERQLKAFFNWMVRENIIETSPMPRIPLQIPKSVIPPIAPEAFEAMFAALKTMPKFAARDEALFFVLIDTMARVSEIAAMRYEDVDFTARTIIVRHGKGNKSRTVSMGDACARALRAYHRTVCHDDDSPLFLSLDGRTPRDGLTDKGIRIRTAVWARVAGLSNVNVTPHNWRRSAAMLFLMDKGDIRTLQAILGHESLEMTRRYLHLTEIDQQRQHRLHSPGDRLKLR